MPCYLPQRLVFAFVYFFFTSYTHCDPQDKLTDLVAGKSLKFLQRMKDLEEHEHEGE